MLDQILRCTQSFARENGFLPNVVFMTPLHYEALMQDIGNLAGHDDNPGIRLGFDIRILPAESLVAPQACYVPPGARHLFAHSTNQDIRQY